MKNQNVETDKATPRPWSRNIRANGKYPVIFSGRNQHVCIVSQQTDPNETEANIDLICDAVNERELVLAVVEAAKEVLEAVGASQHDSITGVLGMGKAVAALDAYRAQKEKR
jgi:hypothetical protein